MTKKDALEFLRSAQAGYNGEAFTGLFTSAMHAAWCCGRWASETGRTAPTECRPSRGDKMHYNGMLLELDWRNVKVPKIERVQ